MSSNPITFESLDVVLEHIYDSILLRGPHGIGKSAVPAALAKRLGLPLLDVRLSLYTEGDLIGVPFHKQIETTGVTTFAPPDWLHQACSEAVILFLDEINRASVGVQNSAFQLILDREVKGMRLHPGTRIFAAINDSAEYIVNEMDPALLDRFVVYDLTPTPHDWVKWASRSGVDEVIVNFIRNHPEHLRPTKAVEPGTVTPTQRSWARLGETLKNAGMTPRKFTGKSKDELPAGFYSICMGYIGAPAAIAFVDYIKTVKVEVSVEDVLNNWGESVIARLAESSAEKKAALVDAIGVHGVANVWTRDQAQNVGRLLLKLPAELKLILWKNVTSARDRLDNVVGVHSICALDLVDAALASHEIEQQKNKSS